MFFFLPVFFVPLVAEVPLIYPVATVFNNEGETGDGEGEN